MTKKSLTRSGGHHVNTDVLHCTVYTTHSQPALGGVCYRYSMVGSSLWIIAEHSEASNLDDDSLLLS